MPVENIHRDGTLMFNKTPKGGVLADSVYSHPGDIHEDDEFNEEDLKKIKDKDPSVSKHWRYLSSSQAKSKKTDRAELEKLANDAELQRQGLTPEALLDSTGPPGDVTIEEEMDRAAEQTTVDVKKDSK